MIKFKEHDGMLFKMLDEPVPLTPDAEMPCLVRFITHGVIGEYVREHWLDCNQKNVPIYIDDVDSDGDVTVWIDENRNEHHCCPFPMFEIIGTLVKEGSAEWALYQMMQGEMVCHETSPWDWYRIYNDHAIQNRTVGYMDRVSAWLESTVQSGWQIYKEPEHESKNIIHGNIPPDMRLKYIDLDKYKVGDWVEIESPHTKGKTFVSVIKEMPNQEHRTVHVNSYCGGYYEIMESQIVRKLKPSEVIVKIGCLSGTVRPVSTNGTHIWFHLIGVDDKTIATIRISCLDKETRKLVEGLLKAQEEEK